MREATGRRRRIAILVAVAIAAAALGVIAYATHSLRSIDLSTIDARFSIRGTDRPSNDVVIVALDDQTLNALNANARQLPRRYYARVIDKLRQAGARAIAFDIEFDRPTDVADDNALIEAVGRASGLVLGTSLVDSQGHTEVFGGDSVVRSVGAVVGSTAVMFDADGVLRRVSYSLQRLKTFAVVLSEQATHRAVPTSEFPGGSVPVDFEGPPGTIASVSMIRVLRGQVPPSAFRGKVVIVGNTSPSYQDLHETAVSGPRPMSGAEYEANAYETVVRGNPLRDGSGLLNLMLVALLGLAVPVASLRRRPLETFAVGALLAAIYLVVAQLAFDSGTILTVVYPLLAVILGTAGSIVADLVLETRERRRLEVTLAGGTAMSDFFICYRRDQSSWPARILRDELVKRFGERSVFMDLDSIDAGQEWPQRIEDEINGCGVILVLIGRDWLHARGANGVRRIDDPEDWVRLEVETGLRARDSVVVPVLLDGASMPDEGKLPESVRGLVRRHAIALDPNHWSTEIDDLVDSIRNGRIRDSLRRARTSEEAGRA